MKQPLFPSTISTQLHFAYFLAVKCMVRKFGKSDSQTGSWCLDKAVLEQGGGGMIMGFVTLKCIEGEQRLAKSIKYQVTHLWCAFYRASVFLLSSGCLRAMYGSPFPPLCLLADGTAHYWRRGKATAAQLCGHR